jgi:hypothetical protein
MLRKKSRKRKKTNHKRFKAQRNGAGRQTTNGLRLKGSKVNVLRHRLLRINGHKPKDGMYPSDEKPRINDYGAVSLGFVTKLNEK